MQELRLHGKRTACRLGSPKSVCMLQLDAVQHSYFTAFTKEREPETENKMFVLHNFYCASMIEDS